MKIRNNSAHPPLTSTLQKALSGFRDSRGFDPDEYIQQKVNLLQKYTDEYNLTACVVAVSGGIDSAIVAALAARLKGVEVVPVLLPATNHEGVTGQDSATSRGINLCNDLHLTPVVIDVAETARVLGGAVFAQLNNSGNDYTESAWGTGQLVPYVRTPALYYVTTLLTDNGKKAFIGGTTNYSEGSYLGYIGKASDAMVDVQFISDIYKSEVYAVAKSLGIRQEIIDVVPTGDMFDATSDENVFGASYDFVELYLETLTWPESKISQWVKLLDDESREYFIQYRAKLDAMHKYNKHKYLAGSPAVHLDINSPQTYEKFWKKTTWE